MGTDTAAGTAVAVLEVLIAHLLLLGVDPARHEHAPRCSPTKAKRANSTPPARRREKSASRNWKDEEGVERNRSGGGAQIHDNIHLSHVGIPSHRKRALPSWCSRPYVAIRGWPLRQHVNTHEANERMTRKHEDPLSPSRLRHFLYRHHPPVDGPTVCETRSARWPSQVVRIKSRSHWMSFVSRDILQLLT